MSSIHRYTVPPDAAGERLDLWLSSRQPDLSRSQIKRYLGEGLIMLNDRPPQKPGVRLSTGDHVSLELPAPPPPQPQPANIALDVLYESASVIVVNKPAGLVVHPAPGHVNDTVVNALLSHTKIDDPEQPQRPGIVHRLDRDTSGVLIVAKSSEARRALQQQFRQRRTTKRYVALVHGTPETSQGSIEGPIGRHPTQRQKRAVVASGRPATTHYRTLQRYRSATALELTPITGRTHQIRVHLAAIRLPVVGDVLYGPARSALPLLDRHFLHAAALTIVLPEGDVRTFEAPLPPELQRYLDQLTPPEDA